MIQKKTLQQSHGKQMRHFTRANQQEQQPRHRLKIQRMTHLTCESCTSCIEPPIQKNINRVSKAIGRCRWKKEGINAQEGFDASLQDVGVCCLIHIVHKTIFSDAFLCRCYHAGRTLQSLSARCFQKCTWQHTLCYLLLTLTKCPGNKKNSMLFPRD